MDLDRFVGRYLGHFQSKQARTVGCEEEIQVVDPLTGEMGDFSAIMQNISMPGWETKYDDIHSELVVGFKGESGSYITTDAGRGTIEINVAYQQDLFALETEYLKLLSVCKKKIAEYGLVLVGHGTYLLTPSHLKNWVRKGRYKYLLDSTDYMVKDADSTASSQTHISVGPEEAGKVNRLLNAATGLAISLCANSSISEGKPNGYSAKRELSWDLFGPRFATRVGMPKIEPSGRIDEYLSGIIDQDFLFYQDENGKWQNCGKPFREFARSCNGNVFDFYKYHEGAVWQNARLRHIFGTVEFRPCCQQPPGENFAVHALALGLVENHKKAWYLLSGYSWLELLDWRESAIRYGINSYLGGQKALGVIPELLTIVEQGLKNRGFGEEIFLKPLWKRIAKNKTGADIAVEVFYKKRNILDVVEAFTI